MLSLTHPAALLLLVVPTVLAAFTYRRGRSGPRRAAVAAAQWVGLAAAIVALAEPVVSRVTPERVDVAVIDLSDAMPDERAADAARGLKADASSTRPRIVAFSNRAATIADASMLADDAARRALRRELTEARYDGEPRGGAAIADALQLAGALVPPGGAGTVRLVSPGVQTRGDAVAELARLASRGIAVSVEPTSPKVTSTLLLDAPQVPTRTSIGETMEVTASATARSPARATAEVWANGQRVAGPVVVDVGTAPTPISIAVPLRVAGRADFELRVAADGIEQRRRASSWVAGPRRVAVVTSEPDASDSFQQLLGPAAAVERVRPDASADDQALVAADLIVLADVRADDLAEAATSRIRARVDAGAGLLVTGGATSFGPGGWAQSPLADLLPVRMPQELERPDPSAAVVFIIDTSGSMGATRLELAKEVARLAMRRLQPQDKAGIVEFYGAKRWAAPLQTATNRLDLTRALNRLTSGGGTEIFPALEEASYALRNVNTRTRHVIVLTDGGVESAPFDKLIRRMADDGQTVSTVIVGGGESPLMESMAEWGNGRCYRVDGRLGIPEILLHQPSTDAPPPIVEAPSRIVPREPDAVTAAIDWSAAPPLEGYARVRAKPSADLLLASEHGDALLARWRYGRGRVAALPTRFGSAWTREIGQWPGAATFFSNLCRSLYGPPADGTLAVDAVVRPAGLEVRAEALVVDPAAATAPLVIEVLDAGQTVDSVTVDPTRANRWNALLPGVGPGSYELRLRTTAGALLGHAATVVPTPTIEQRFGPNEELTREAERYATIARGHAPARGATTYVSLAGPLVLLSMIALLLNVFLRRGGSTGRTVFRQSAITGIACALIVASASSPARADDAGSTAKRVIPATTSPAANAHDLAELATEQESSGDAAAATASLRAAVEAERDAAARDRLRVRLAILLHDTGDADAAFDVMKARAAERPRDPSTLFLASLLGRPDLVTSLPAAPPDDAFQALLEGAALLESGDAAKAEARFAAASRLAKEPRDRRFATERVVASARAAGTLPALVDAWLAEPSPSAERVLLLANVLRDLGRVDDLFALLRRTDAAALGSDDAEASLVAEVIGGAADAGRLADAEALCRERWSADPSNRLWLKSMVGILLGLDRAADADAAFDRAAAAAPTFAATMRVAKLAVAVGRDDAAVAVASRATERFAAADRVASLLFVARIERGRGRPEEADERLAAALRVAGNDVRLLRTVADAYEQAGATAKAIELYRAIAADDASARPRLAWLLKAAGDLKAAQAIWADIAAAAPSESRRAEAQDRMLDLASSTGTIGEIAAALEDRVRDGRATADDVQQLVRIYVGIDDPFSAADVLRRAAGPLGGEVEALRRLADLYVQCGQFGLADRTLRTLVERDPEHASDALQRLAALAIERNRPDDARAALAEVARRSGDDSSSAALSGGVYAQLNMHEEAAAAYARAIAERPDQPESWILWANAMKGAKRGPEAVRRLSLLAARTESDEAFAVAIDGLLNLDAPRDALRVARRAALVRLTLNCRKLIHYELVRELSQAVGDAATSARAGELSLLVAGEQRSVLLREMIAVAAASGRPERSLDYQRTLLALGDQVPPQVFLDIGSRLLAGGQEREAERAFRRAVEVSEDETTRLQIARVYEKAGQLRVALRMLAPLADRRPTDVELRDRVAALGELSGDFDAAMTHYAGAVAALVRQGSIAAGLEPARSFDAGVSKSVGDAERYLDGALRGLVNVARSPALQDRAASVARAFVSERLPVEPSADAVPRELADVARLLRRVAFAVHRPEVADAADREIIDRYPDDRAFVANAIAQRRTWGLASRADAFGGADDAREPSASTRPLGPDDIALRVPPLILRGELDAARSTLAEVWDAAPAKAESFPLLIASALALDDVGSASAWAKRWLDSASTAARGEPDVRALRECVRSTWLAIDVAERRTMVERLRTLAQRSTGDARRRLALLALDASLALGDEDAASRLPLATDAADAADLSAETLVTLVRAVPEDNRVDIVTAAGRAWLPAKRRALLLSFANANELPLGAAGTAALARAIAEPVPTRTAGGEDASPRFVPNRSTRRPEVWRAIADAIAARGATSTDDALLMAQAYALAGAGADADRAATDAAVALLVAEGDVKLPDFLAAIRALTPAGAERLLAAADERAGLDAGDRLLLAAALNERLGRWDQALDAYAQAFAARPDDKGVRGQLVAMLRGDLRWARLLDVFQPFARDATVADGLVKANLNTARTELAWTPDADISAFSIYTTSPGETGTRAEREQRRFRAFHQLLRQRRESSIYPARVPVRSGGLLEFDGPGTGRPTVYQALAGQPWAGEEFRAALRATPPGAIEAEAMAAGLAMTSAPQRQVTLEHLAAISRDAAMTTNDRTLLLALRRTGADAEPWIAGEVGRMLDEAEPSDLRRLRDVAAVLGQGERRASVARWLSAASRTLRDGSRPASPYSGVPLQTSGIDETNLEDPASAFAPPGTDWNDEAESARIERIAATHREAARSALADAERRGLFDPDRHPRTALLAARLAAEAGDADAFVERLMRAIDASLGRPFPRMPDVRRALPGEASPRDTQAAAARAALEAMIARADAEPADRRDMVRLVSLVGRWAVERKLDAEAAACVAAVTRLAADVGEHVLWAADLSRAAGDAASADAMELRLARANALPAPRFAPLIASLRTTDAPGADDASRLAGQLAGPATRPAATTLP